MGINDSMDAYVKARKKEFLERVKLRIEAEKRSMIRSYAYSTEEWQINNKRMVDGVRNSISSIFEKIDAYWEEKKRTLPVPYNDKEIAEIKIEDLERVIEVYVDMLDVFISEHEKEFCEKI